jgi:hypothetical protein
MIQLEGLYHAAFFCSPQVIKVGVNYQEIGVIKSP